MLVITLCVLFLIGLAWCARAHPRAWHQAVVFVETFEGFLGVVALGLCAVAIFLVADAFIGDDDRSRAGRRDADS